ncbi:unnamed protein product [Rotaria socialis]|uniref:PAS domain-containing protein n=2 Tax=Rotaria socialis TaxID=392032 RepID=A0A820RBH0_9BILA|nr:unnamed protein product [Rotaria socialis]CAF3208888.1 unnamed protein product [Rotaria socialis]CAF3450190.1 unnamed protein product [Rotaria socialis]CAF3504560.1 unnamed protein product [Rotaria socialis]CAF4305207.1 unnamed protein product [Rotaria socialis]
MQNTPQFFSNYNPYQIDDNLPPNVPNTLIDGELFGLPSSSSSAPMATNPTSVMSQSTASPMNRSQKRKATTDTDASYSPASICSENSNYSNASYPTISRQSTDCCRNLPSGKHKKSTTASILTTSAEEGSSGDNDDEDDDNNDLAHKREKHTQVEAHRRALEKAHFRELSMLITNRSDSKSTKLHHLDLLKIAADQISEMNLRHKNDPLRPSNLTDNELNFLTVEASNSFLFVTTVEQATFPIIHVTDAINRILNVTRDQWLGQDFLKFIHPEDLARYQSLIMSLNQRIGLPIHFECRLKQQGNPDMYSSVIIDGMTKIIDHALKPVQNNTSGFLAFVAICHLPLITKYSETNMRLYKDPQSCTFRCRCSPNDWKIFLVDRSVSTLPSISYDLFRQKSILDFIHNLEQQLLHQTLSESLRTPTVQTVRCHFMHPTLHISMPMSLEIKSFFNTVTHQVNFIELTFKGLTNSPVAKVESSITFPYDYAADADEIDKLFESDPSVPNQQIMNEQFDNNPMIQPTPNYYQNR